MVGIDLSPLVVEVSRLRGFGDARVMDVTAMSFPDSHFDTVLLMGANLGIVGDIM